QPHGLVRGHGRDPRVGCRGADEDRVQGPVAGKVLDEERRPCEQGGVLDPPNRMAQDRPDHDRPSLTENLRHPAETGSTAVRVANRTRGPETKQAPPWERHACRPEEPVTPNPTVRHKPLRKPLRRLVLSVMAALSLGLASCGHTAPSVLDPHGPGSARIAGLWWFMF